MQSGRSSTRSSKADRDGETNSQREWRPVGLTHSLPPQPGPAFPEARWPEPTATSIVVVDDEPGILKVLTKFLTGKGYIVRPFESSLEARDALLEECPDLLLTDRRMPDMDGLELARIAMEEDPNLPVVILTGEGDLESATEGLRLGIADYLSKPPELAELESTLWRALVKRTQAEFHREVEGWMRQELEDRADEAVRKAQQLEDVTVGAFSALVSLLERRCPQYEGHSKAVADLSASIAKACHLPPPDIDAIRTAGFLHDIGMVAVPDALVEKTSPLTPEELDQIKSHCWVGADILRPFTHLGPVSDFVLWHHERMDGSGYPDHLLGDAVPLGAQIVGAADTFCAMTEERPFRSAMDPTEALAKMIEKKDAWFSAAVVDALAAVVHEV